jgi:hypothetical protein
VSVTTLRVPYITAWSDEVVPARLAFQWHPEAGGLRLTYTDAVEQDRMFGVLWARQGISQQGRPEWKLVNTLRQRRAMLHHLCQVCGQPATDPATGRVWWLLADDPTDTSEGDGYTNAPPTCRQCIPEALASCPRLRRSAAVYTVADSEPYGVLAHTFLPVGREQLAMDRRSVTIPLDAFVALESAMATQMLVLLRGLRRQSTP